MRITPDGLHASFLAAALAALAALAAGCAGATAKLRPCAAAEECPTGARCLQQVCVANAPPIAVVPAPSAGLEVAALVTFDGSESFDPDAPGDSVTSHAWAFSAVDAACDPPTVAGTTARAVVRFGCPGRYAVTLVVTDELAASSAASRREIVILPRSAPPLVQAGPDLAPGHRCAGDPLRCNTAVEVVLSAAAANAQGPVTYRWTVAAPPDRPLGTDRRVTFVPGPDDPAPIVVIETDGTAISGDWVFTVEARDTAGVLGTAATRVSVGNTPPTLDAAAQEFPHAFDPVTSQFSVSGALGVSVVDPDGDPIGDRAAVWRHSGDHGALFTGKDLGDRLAFNVIVPYAAPTDAHDLIGGLELSRTIELSVRDVNGAAAVAAWPIVIGNRPPLLSSSPASVTTNHTYDAMGARYLASASLSTWSDPDGDPLEQASPTGDTVCRSFEVVDGRSIVGCELAFVGLPAVKNFAGEHLVQQRVRDPFSLSAQTSAVRLVISNRTPRVVTQSQSVSVACVESRCCKSDSETRECLDYLTSFSGATFLLDAGYADDDGDPLDVRASGTNVVNSPSSVCAPASCTLSVALAPVTECGQPAASSVSTTVTDGDLAATASVLIYQSCPL